MDNLLNYKGFHGSVEVSIRDGVMHGKILHIADLVTYEAATIPELKGEFEAAVDDYLDTCKQLGKAAEKPCSGAFNVRTTPSLHKKLGVIAASQGSTLNNVANQAFEQFVAAREHGAHEPKTIIVRVEQSGVVSSAGQEAGKIVWTDSSSYALTSARVQ